MKHKVFHSCDFTISQIYFLATGVLSFFVLTQSVFAEIILPGRCHMGECWETKFVGKALLKVGNSGTIYSVKTTGRAWKMNSQPPRNFDKPKIHYVYCSKTKPAFIFKTDGGTYYAHLLNPGGRWYGYNKGDYPIYWATCHNTVGPNFFSEEMTTRAVKLGYPLNLSSDQIELNNPLDILE